MEKIKSKRGFASMSPEKRAAIASMGGKAVKPENRAFSKNAALASNAGKKGGKAVKKERRAFSMDRDLAVRAGRKGGSVKGTGDLVEAEALAQIDLEQWIKKNS